jgi:SAM-dependent methyltransferase
MPDAYQRHLGEAVFRPYAVDLARRAAELRPARILELAAGTAEVTAELVRQLPDAQVVATDLNSAMVEYGRQRVPGVEWQVADAERLPFVDGSFDLVVCQFGVMFFPDKARAHAEVERVLTAGGRSSSTCGGPLDTHVFQAAAQAAAAAVFPDDPPTFLPAVPHGYHDVSVIIDHIEAGGLPLVSCQEVVIEGRAASAASLAEGYCLGTPMFAQLEARGLDEASLRSIKEEMERLLGDGPVSGSMSALVVEAEAA